MSYRFSGTTRAVSDVHGGLHWARVETVYVGASIADADAAGFNELQVPAADVLKIGGSKVALVQRRIVC